MDETTTQDMPRDGQGMHGLGDEQGALTRRQVLQAAGAGLALLLPMAALADATPAPWTSVGKDTDFVKDTPKRVALADGSIVYVTRQGPSALIAVSAKCTHRGCEVGWKTADTQFHCPCHGAVFAVTGKNVHGTSRSPATLLPNLPTVPVRQQGTDVQVSLPAGGGPPHPGA